MDDTIKKLIEEHNDTFEALASTIRCPGCSQFIRAPLYNLGKNFHYAEGCADCAVAAQGHE